MVENSVAFLMAFPSPTPWCSKGQLRGEQQSGPQFPSTKRREQRDQICNVLNSGLPKRFVSLMSSTDYTDSQKVWDLRLNEAMRSSGHGLWKLKVDFKSADAWGQEIAEEYSRTAKIPRSRGEILMEFNTLWNSLLYRKTEPICEKHIQGKTNAWKRPQKTLSPHAALISEVLPQHEASLQRLGEAVVLCGEFSTKDHMHTKKQNNMVHSKEKIDLQKHPEQIQPSDLLDKDFKTTILNTLRGKYKELTEIRKMI